MLCVLCEGVVKGVWNVYGEGDDGYGVDFGEVLGVEDDDVCGVARDVVFDVREVFGVFVVGVCFGDEFVFVWVVIEGV